MYRFQWFYEGRSISVKLDVLGLSDVVIGKEGNVAPRTEEVLPKTHFYFAIVFQDTERGDDCCYG